MRLSNRGGPHFTNQAVGKLLRQPHETHFHRRISTELEAYDHNQVLACRLQQSQSH